MTSPKVIIKRLNLANLIISKARRSGKMLNKKLGCPFNVRFFEKIRELVTNFRFAI